MERFYSWVNVAERFQNMDSRSQIILAAFVLMIVFGIVNSILGYRLLRFWMMLGGIALGAVLGYFVIDSLGMTSQNLYVFGIAGCGIALGVLTFFIYRAGIFAVGAAAGFVGSFYLLHPMAYSTLFVCLLCGMGLGILTLKFSRSIIIITTSILGGSMVGFGSVRLAGLPDLPYGILIGAVVMIFGIGIQFIMNKPEKKDEKESNKGVEEQGCVLGQKEIDF